MLGRTRRRKLVKRHAPKSGQTSDAGKTRLGNSMTPHELLLRSICRSKAVYAFNGFVISGAGWIAVEFDEEGLPILTEKITRALEAAK